MGTLYSLPDLGEGITRAEIVGWHVKVGDRIEEEAPMVVVLTDKATVEIPSPRSGFVRHIFAEVDEIVWVGGSLIEIGDENEPPYEAPPPNRIVIDEHREATPAYMRQLARDLGVDVDHLGGNDVERIEAHPVSLTSSPPSLLSSMPPRPIPAPAPRPPTVRPPESRRLVSGSDRPPGSRQSIPLRGVRRAIAERLVRAQLIPAVTVVEEVDITALEELQKTLGYSFVPFVIQAALAAFEEVPEANSILEDGGHELVVFDQVDVGVATQTTQGLMVPIIRDVAKKSLEQLETLVLDLGSRAREGTLEAAELRGATFTVTIPGHFGGLLATPLLNPPQVAVLGFNRPTRRPVVIDEAVVIRSMAYLTLTFDHRAFDGIAAGTFLLAVRDHLAAPLKAIRAGVFR